MCGCGSGGSVGSGTVQGTVVDTAYAPISGATVSIGSVSTLTDSSGSYSLTGISMDLQTLSVSAAGYISETRQITVSALETTHVSMIVLAKKDGKSSDFGSAGGQATNTDGSVIVTIPDNALTSTTTITVTKCDVGSAPVPAPTGYYFVSLVYITPVTVSLSKSVTLTIPLPSEAASYSSIPFFRFDPTTLNWVLLTNSGIVDKTSNTVSIDIAGFGWLAAAIPLGSSYGTVTGKVISSASAAIVGASVWNGTQITVTDSLGNYSLSNIPTGSQLIYASCPGYTNNNVPVTVQSLTSVFAPDIVLIPVSTSYGSVSGKITDSSSSSPISGARIVCSGKTGYSDSSGNYTILGISPGSVTVAAYAYGYSNKSVSVTVTAGATSTADFSLDKVTAASFSDDFETDKGWTTSISDPTSPRSLWHRVANNPGIKDTLAPTYVTLPDYSTNQGSIPLAHGGSYSYWFGDDSTGCYIGSQNPDDFSLSGGRSLTSYQGDLISPSINLAGYSNVTLTFWSWWEIESKNPASVDQMKVDVSGDGSLTWTNVAKLNPVVEDPRKMSYLPISSGGFNSPGVWVKQQVDLTDFAGKIVNLRFSFRTSDTNYNGFRGWFIDDVSVDSSVISAASMRK